MAVDTLISSVVVITDEFADFSRISVWGVGTNLIWWTGRGPAGREISWKSSENVRQKIVVCCLTVTLSQRSYSYFDL